MSRGRAAAPVGLFHLLLLLLVLLLGGHGRGCDAAAAVITEDDKDEEPPPPPPDYAAALSKSLLYFEAQRSGRLPHNQRVRWRGHSGLTDGLQQGVDLVGGYYDAGDHVKFGLPMAFTVTMLAWGAIDFADDVDAAGEWGHTLEAIKWGTDYFVKAHTEPFVYWAEVGDGDTDHYCWQRPEDMTTSRQAYRIDKDNPGSDLAAETAAALAAASIVFRRSNPHYSHLLLHHAQQLFVFGDMYRGTYDSSIAEVRSFYASVSGYRDELLWAALWLHRATGREDYLRYAVDNADAFGGVGWAMTEFSWDVKYAGVQVLAAKVSRAVAEEKRIVFTGHSSGGSIATLAAIWFLEKCTRQGSVNQAHPFCVTFGAPLIGDNIFNHAVRREGWSKCILNFVLPLDIVPRIPLTPLASLKEEIQTVLDWLSPQTPSHSPVGRSLAIPEYYETLLRSTLSIASYEACSFMGCTSSILGTLTSFIELSPYRPCGTYLFLISSEQLIVLTNSDAVLQLFFYCLQLDLQQQLLDAAARSLTAHWQYEPIKQDMQDIVCVDYLGTISSALPGRQSNRTAIGSIELSKEAILHLSAAAQWEKQRHRNQTKIIDNCKKIQEALKSLNEYKRTCELHGASYYDSFKFQREVHDFNANVRRLELAGLWDEIVEMLRRRELPDGFEGLEEWVNLGTLYRRLVEPLDIANYYRHSKNEDTGSYLSKGRPRRYKYTQKWHEQLQRVPFGSSLESCFWAMVEELQAEMTDGRSIEDLRDKVTKLESDTHGWLTSGSLGKDVLLSSSSFVVWWKTLPEQHRSTSCILKLMPQ